MRQERRKERGERRRSVKPAAAVLLLSPLYSLLSAREDTPC